MRSTLGPPALGAWSPQPPGPGEVPKISCQSFPSRQALDRATALCSYHLAGLLTPAVKWTGEQRAFSTPPHWEMSGSSISLDPASQERHPYALRLLGLGRYDGQQGAGRATLLKISLCWSYKRALELLTWNLESCIWCSNTPDVTNTDGWIRKHVYSSKEPKPRRKADNCCHLAEARQFCIPNSAV